MLSDNQKSIENNSSLDTYETMSIAISLTVDGLALFITGTFVYTAMSNFVYHMCTHIQLFWMQ